METDIKNQILSFKLKKQSYGIFIENIKEIIKAPEEVSKYVGNKSVKGIISYREGSLPIIDLNEKIEGHKCDNIKEKFIIVVEKNEQNCGFLVEQVETIKTSDNKTLTEVPDVIDNNDSISNEEKYVNKLFRQEERIIPILDLHKMI